MVIGVYCIVNTTYDLCCVVLETYGKLREQMANKRSV